MLRKPPNWRKGLTQDLFKKALASEELRGLVKHAEKDYVYWDPFLHYKMPEGFMPEDAWSYVKFTRQISISSDIN